MSFLLDTHALVWAILEPERLSKKARAVIENPTNLLYVSSVSAFEVANKHRLGKWPEVGDVLQHYAEYLAELSTGRLDIKDAHALMAGSLVMAHRDPFDRLLIAQALTEGFSIVTADPAFQGVPKLNIVW